MSQPGWYPDPAGTPHRYRYWDGHAWSEETTDNPAGASLPTAPSMSQPTAQSTSGAAGRRRWGPVIMIIAAVLIVALVGVLVVQGLRGDSPVVEPDPGPLPSSSVSGWDDSSAIPSPEPSLTPSEEPSVPTPSAVPSEELPLQPCPQGMPISRQDHPSDGRIHGGGLSFPRVRGWDEGSGIAYSWAFDVGEQSIKVESPNWYANLAVGALFTGDGFDEPKRAADLVMQCVITSGLYPHFTERQDVWSKPVTVDGHPAWSIRANVLNNDPKLKAKGDTVEVIVVDADSPESLSMFIGQVSLGDTKLLRTLDSTIKNLRVE